jgi:hypothetical protein
MGMIDYRARNVQENRLSRVSLRDRKIIELLGRENSPAVVAEQFGMDPAEVVAIAKDLLSGMDIFTELEQRRLLVFQLKSLLSQARELLDNTITEAVWPKGVDAITNLIKTTYEIQLKEETRNTEEIEAATKAQAAILIRAVELSYLRAMRLLSERYPEVDLSEINDAFNQGLLESAEL